MRKSLGILVALCATMFASTPVLAAVHVDPGRQLDALATTLNSQRATFGDVAMTSTSIDQAALPAIPSAALGDHPADGTFSSIAYMQETRHSNQARGADVQLGRALN